MIERNGGADQPALASPPSFKRRGAWVILLLAFESSLVFLLANALSGLPWALALAIILAGCGFAAVLLLPRRRELVTCIILILVPWGLVGKYALDVRVTLFLCVALMVAAFYISEKLVTGDATIGRSYVSRPMWLLFGAALLSFVNAESVTASLRLTGLMVLGCFLYLFLVKNIRTLEEAKRAILVFGFASILPTLLALYEFRAGVLVEPTGRLAMPETPLRIGAYIRPDAMFPTANSFAAYLGLTLPILGVTIFIWRSKIAKILNLAVLMCAMTGLVVSLSRTSWVGSSLSLVVMLLFGVSFRHVRRIATVAFFFLLGVAGVVLRVAPLSVLYRLITLLDLGQDMAVRIRLQLWHAARELFLQNPVVGIGIGNFPERYPPLVASWVRNNYANAHNAYLNVAAEMGVIGLIGLSWLLGITLWTAVQNYRLARDQHTKLLSLGLLGGWIAFWVGNLGDFVWMTPYHVAEIGIFWSFLALTAVLESGGRRRWGIGECGIPHGAS